MICKGFKMKLYPGMEKEYEKRHNQLWPEMKDMIHEYGGKNYSIYLDPETMSYMDISKLKMKKNGHRVQIQRLTVNGGILWQILWKPMKITVLSAKI